MPHHPFRLNPTSPPSPGPARGPSPRRILWLRPDAVGDAILALGMLPPLARRFPEARITVVCLEVVAPLYLACPHVDEVVAFDRVRAVGDASYQAELAGRLRAVGADLCLHSVHSRDVLGDLLARASGAPEVIGIGGDLCNMTAEEHRVLDPVYTRLLPPLGHLRAELDRHAGFLRALGCEPGTLRPTLWLRPEDERAADAILAGLGLEPGKAIAVFPGSKAVARLYPRLGEALRPLAAEGHPLLVVGSSAERSLGDQVLAAAGGRGWNLCQSLPLLVTGALLRRCRLAVGVESGLVQLAAAVGLPAVVAYGGSYFGRFLPSSPLTSCAALPLDCFGCDGRCVHPRAHCLEGLEPVVLQAAIRDALAGPAARPRLYLQQRWEGPTGGPRRVELASAPAGTEVIPVEAGLPPRAPGPIAAPVAAAAPPPVARPRPRITVICAVWSQDPLRLERLRGHQACLARQTVPVDRVYVFDGGDPPPPWLDGRAVVAREPLGLYEAWNVALPLVRTPFVMNLNLDDRLNPDAAGLLERALDDGADLVGGEWHICFTQDETDAVEPCAPAGTVPFFPDWPPRAGRPVRLGSGTGERGTLGPACAWRMALHAQFPRYPFLFGDGSPLRVIGDFAWWTLLERAGKRLRRLPIVVGRYLSEPSSQAEFRNPAAPEHEKLERLGLARL